MSLNRRSFLSAGAGAAALAGLTACSSVRSGVTSASESTGSSEDQGSKSDLGKQTGTLSFAFWGGSDGETAGFTNAKNKFEAANPGAKIELKVVPFDGFFAGIDRGLQSNTAPDVFRVDYTTIGKYSSKDVLLDMTPYFTPDEVDAFLDLVEEELARLIEENTALTARLAEAGVTVETATDEAGIEATPLPTAEPRLASGTLGGREPRPSSSSGSRTWNLLP